VRLVISDLVHGCQNYHSLFKWISLLQLFTSAQVCT